MELSDFAEICDNLKNEDSEVSLSALGTYNEYIKAQPGDFVSKLLALILQSDEVFYPIILLKQATSNSILHESIGFQGFWSLYIPHFEEILSKLSSANEMEMFSIAIANISVIDSNSLVQTVLPFIFEIISNENFFPFAITTLTNIMLLADKDITFEFVPFFEQATTQSSSDDEFVLRMKLFFSLIPHFSAVGGISEYFAALPTLLPESLVVEYLNQLISLLERFRGFFGVSIMAILPALISYGKAGDEDVSSKALMILSSTAEFYRKNDDVVAEVINTFLLSLQKIGDEEEWDDEEDMQTLPRVALNLFSEANSEFNANTVLKVLFAYKESNDMSNWKVIYSYVAALGEINLMTIRWRADYKVIINTLLSELIPLCAIGQEMHPRVKVSALICLNRIVLLLQSSDSDCAEFNELISPLLLTKCENESSIAVVKEYLDVLSNYLCVFQCENEDMLPVLEWCVSSLDGSNEITAKFVACISSFFEFFGERILPSIEEIFAAFDAILSDASDTIVEAIIDAVANVASKFSDQMDLKEQISHFCAVAFEQLSSSDDETHTRMLEKAIYRFILCSGDTISDTLLEMIPGLLENSQQEIDVVSFPRDNGITEVPGHTLSICTEEETVFVNCASEYAVYSSMHLLLGIIPCLGENFPEKEAIVELCSARITDDVFSHEVSKTCWEILLRFVCLDSSKEITARTIISLIPSSRISYLSSQRTNKTDDALCRTIIEAYLMALKCIQENSYTDVEGFCESLVEIFSYVENNLGVEQEDAEFDYNLGYDSPIKDFEKIFNTCFKIFPEETCQFYAEKCMLQLDSMINRSNGFGFVYGTLPYFFATSEDFTSFPVFRDQVIESLKSDTFSRSLIAANSLKTMCEIINLGSEDCTMFYETLMEFITSESVCDDDIEDVKDVCKLIVTKIVVRFGSYFEQGALLSNWFSIAQPKIKSKNNAEIFELFAHLCNDSLPAFAESVGANEILRFIVHNVLFEFVPDEMVQTFTSFARTVVSEFGADPNTLDPSLQGKFAEMMQ